MQRRTLGFAASLMLCLASPPSGAHHSPAAYDPQAVVTIEGIVVKYDWASPHVYLTIRESGDEGERVWEVETFPPSTLKQMGWPREALVVGDRVSLTANPGRNRARSIASLLTLTVGGATVYDGTRVFAGGDGDSGAGAVQGTDGAAAASGPAALEGTWATAAEPVLGLFFGQAAKLPVTPKGAAAIREFTDAENPGADCVPFSAPAYTMLPGFKNIEVRDDAVVIRGEIDAVERIVHLDVRSHDGAPASVQGHSIGAWDGDAFVVDTARFAEHRLGLAAGLPSSAAKHLVERFELDAGGRTLTYRFTLEDPEYLAEPVDGTLRWTARPDVAFTPVACDLEVARRFRNE